MHDPIKPEDVQVTKKIYITLFVSLILLFILGLTFLTSCNALPDLIRAADDIFDSAVKISVDKEALQKDTDLEVNIKIINKAKEIKS